MVDIQTMALDKFARQQSINTNRNVNDNVIRDVKSQIIGRYILFKVMFKFNSKKEKEEKDE